VRFSGFFEFDMTILGVCKDKPFSVTGMCRVLGSHDSDLSGFHRRVAVLVDRGLLVQVFIGKRFLSGKPKNSVRHYVTSEVGAKALFFYNQAKAFYAPQIKGLRGLCDAYV
jgi:hypothetical protein